MPKDLGRKRNNSFITWWQETSSYQNGHIHIYNPLKEFLCTRVTDPDVNNWKSWREWCSTSRRCLAMSWVYQLTIVTYLNGGSTGPTQYIQISEAKPGVKYQWDRDLSTALPIDKKNNTTSSTETKVVAAAHVLLQDIWTRYFLEEQGYIAKHIIMQDNDSAHKLELNSHA